MSAMKPRPSSLRRTTVAMLSLAIATPPTGR
jgi:hypothetical protein